jgi:TRAP-type C4-dicarboxylate transport system substrate-binding protein
VAAAHPAQAAQEPAGPAAANGGGGGGAGRAASPAPAPITIRVLGGLAEISQYVAFEEPFWSRRVPEITGGRLRAEVAPFDRSGIRGQEMLQLMRLGVVPFGTVLLGLAAADEPELNAVDLPVLNPDIAALRRTVSLWRPHMAELLRERYGVELLSVYTYPAQVVFCRDPFSGLSDLAGRRVRTSSVGQSELVSALGGVPVVMPFAEIVAGIRTGVVECAITAALSGNAIGLHEATSHVSRLAVSWGVSAFGANIAAWEALPPQIRAKLRQGLQELEEEIWRAAERQTEDGLACNAGRPGCREGRPGRMTAVEERWQDESRRLVLLRETVLPSWLQRCGGECAEGWNTFMAPVLGLWARPD